MRQRSKLLRKGLIITIIILFLYLAYIPITNAQTISYNYSEHGIGFIHIRGIIKDLEFIDKNYFSFTSIRTVAYLLAFTNFEPYFHYLRVVSKNERIDIHGQYSDLHSFGIITNHYINMFYYDIF